MSDFYGSYPLKIQVIIHLLQFLIYISSVPVWNTKLSVHSIHHSEIISVFRLRNIREKSIHMLLTQIQSTFFPMNLGLSSFYLDVCLSTPGRFFSMVWLCLNDGLFTNLMNLLSSLTVTKITMLSLIFRGFSKKQHHWINGIHPK